MKNYEKILVVFVILSQLISAAWLANIVFFHASPLGAYGQLGDEAVIIQGAERIIHGQVPHRDFFSSQGGGTYYPLAVAFKIFGDGVSVVRAVNFLNALTICLALLWLCWPLLRYASAFVSLYFVFVIFPVWPFLSHHWMVLLLALASTSIIIHRRSYWLVGLAGFIAATGLSIIHNKAIMLLLAQAVFIFIVYRKQAFRWRWIGSYSAGALLAFGIMIMAAVFSGALPEFVQQVLINNFIYYPNQTPASFFHFNHIVSIVLISNGIVFAPLARLAWREPKHREPYLAMALVFAGMSISILYFLEEVHLAQIFIFFLPLLFAIFYQLGSSVKKNLFALSAKHIIPLGLSILLSGLFAYVSNIFIQIGYSNMAIIPRRLPSFATSKGSLLYQTNWGLKIDQEFPAVAQLLKSSLANQKVFFLPYAPGYYYFNGRDNPTSFDYVATNNQPVRDFEKLKRELENVDAVVYIPSSWWGFSSQGRVMTYIKDRFPLQQNYPEDSIQVFRKNVPNS